MSKDMIMVIQDKSDWDKLPKTVEYIVLYTHYRDSLGMHGAIYNSILPCIVVCILTKNNNN